ncbi:MAG: hypothetical protein ABW044_09400 [Cellvibrio sp.]
MKIKSLLRVMVFALSFFAVSAKADVLINTSSCSWKLVYSQSGVVGVFNSVCANTEIPTISKVVTNNGSTCQYSVYNANYYVNGSCSSYTLYKKTGITSSSPSSSASSVSACKASGKAGKFVTSGSSSGVVGAAQTAAAYCSPQCGTYSTTTDSYTYKFYCSLN